MAAAIPISQIVSVTPSVLTAAGSAVDLNGLLLTNSTYPPIGSVLSFASANDVGAYFGLASAEFAWATVYFNGYTGCTKTPGLLNVAQYNTAAVAGYLRGGSLAAMTLTQLQALSGVLTVTIDGGAPKTSTTINLSAATSFANAATLIAAGFTSLGATVTFDATKSAFIFTSSTTGATSSVSFASGTLSAGLMLTAATGAVMSAGAAIAAPGTFMAGITAVTQNWALFAPLWEPTIADKKAFSDWANAQNGRFGFACHDSDVNALTAGNTTTWGYYLQAGNLTGTVPVWGTSSHTALVLGYAASLDFARLNGRATMAFKAQTGLTASVTSASNASALQTNGYNYFGAYANAKQGFNFLYPGSVSGTWKWLDSFLNQIWLNANLQGSMINLLTSVGSIPYNSQGYGLIQAALLDPINAAINFGAIRVGTTLSASQVAQIQYAVGQDVSSTISAKGYYLQIVPASAQIRAARTSPSMTLYYADGGSVHALSLASIEIQ